jgi:hypothetical protein
MTVITFVPNLGIDVSSSAEKPAGDCLSGEFFALRQILDLSISLRARSTRPRHP